MLRTEFQRQGLNSNGISFVASLTKVPYYIIDRSLSASNSGSAIGLLYLDTDVDIVDCWGYDSYIGTLILVNTTGYIQNLTIYGNILDSYGYMITQSWLNTYVNRSVLESLQFGVDAIPVTGATFSSTGIIDGVRDAGKIVVNDYQQLTKHNEPTNWKHLYTGSSAEHIRLAEQRAEPNLTYCPCSVVCCSSSSF